MLANKQNEALQQKKMKNLSERHNVVQLNQSKLIEKLLGENKTICPYEITISHRETTEITFLLICIIT